MEPGQMSYAYVSCSHETVWRLRCLARGKSRSRNSAFVMMAVVNQTLIDPSELSHKIVDVLSDRQAEDIVLLDINAVASFADYFVIATALNPRHMNALLDAFDKELPNQGIKPLRREGEAGSGWVLVDFGAVIVHIFTPEGRDYYDLEGLWSRAGVPAVRFQ